MTLQQTNQGHDILGAYLIADEIEEMMKKEEAREKRENLRSETAKKTAEVISA
ncbi:MAG: hypothetical protein PHR68_01790 [Candidatus Gracilibacteria bacterium]|nr:hypothetical protein [Candidatus Gracilibacteria bacterium]